MTKAPEGVLKGDLSKMMNYFWAPMEFKFAISVAAVCCSEDPGKTPNENAQFVQHILERVFDKSDLEVKVKPMAYPVSSKRPLIISINGDMHRLLWYSPGMKALKLADELYGLLYDVVFDPVAALA